MEALIWGVFVLVFLLCFGAVVLETVTEGLLNLFFGGFE